MPLWIGLTLYGAGALVLILAPVGSLAAILLYVFLTAVGTALVNPRKDALLQLNLDAQERPDERPDHCFHGGALLPLRLSGRAAFSLDRRLPFVFSFLLFAAAMLVVARIREPAGHRTAGIGLRL